MDMLQILVISVVCFMGFIIAIMNFLAARKERKRQIKAEQKRRAKNRKRTVEFFIKQGETI